MKAFVIGASGLVGSNCLAYFTEEGWTVKGSHCTYSTGNTVYYDTSRSMDEENFEIIGFRPDVIIHCGALTNVDYCESHEEESFKQTVESTRHVCELVTRCNARLVYISTDYVFNGNAGPYKEEDIPDPINIYGKHKYLAEQLALKVEHSLVLRITNVYGDEARAKNFIARIVQQCQQKEKTISLKLPYDQFATPINARDVARAMFHLLTDKKTGIYHLASTDFMNRVELAKRVLSYFPHAQCSNIESVDTATLKQSAKRPLRGGLLKLKFTDEYPTFAFTNVDDYLRSTIKMFISM
jgi:dTDP-4-dehydrorhamnose reductase